MKILCDYCDQSENHEPSLAVAECEVCKMVDGNRTTLCKKHTAEVPTNGGLEEVCPMHEQEWESDMRSKYI